MSSPHHLSRYVTISVLSIAAVGFAYAWVGPSATAPNNNANPPVNVGPSAQTKAGSFGVAGSMIIGSALSVGTNGAPVQTLDVGGGARITGGIIDNSGVRMDANGGWFRTYGGSGWYNETYFGGLYMTDTTWIRTYSDDSIWTNNGLLGSQGGLTVGYGGASPSSGGAIISGNVGIGTATGLTRLTVSKDSVAITSQPFGDWQGNGQVFITGATNSNKRLALGVDTAAGTMFGAIQAIESGVSLRPLSLNPSGGNVGIGITNPGVRLDVAGTIRSTSGGFAFPDGTTQATAWVPGSLSLYESSITNLNSALTNGFYQADRGSATITGSIPDGDHPWIHLITARHSNAGNNHQLQIASSYSDNNRLFFRKIQDNAPTWKEVATRGGMGLSGIYGIRLGDVSNGEVWSGIALDGAATTKTAVIHYGGINDNVLRFGRYGDNAGGWEANVVNFDMDAPSGSVDLWESGVFQTAYGIRDLVGQRIDGGGGWFRTYGDTGWYNQTYEGGFYMIDPTWVRLYNGKSLYAGAATIRTDGRLEVGGNGSTFVAVNGGNVGVKLSPSNAHFGVNGTGTIGGANNIAYDIGAGRIAAGDSIYSYDKICAANSAADCEGPGGIVISGANIKFPDASTLSSANGLWNSDAIIFKTSLMANGMPAVRTSSTSYVTLDTVYGPFMYGTPNCPAGRVKRFKVFAELVDNITNGGQNVEFRIDFTGASTDLVFNMGTTWGGDPWHRTWLSGAFNDPGTWDHANIQIRINGNPGPYVVIRNAELWTVCQAS